MVEVQWLHAILHLMLWGSIGAFELDLLIGDASHGCSTHHAQMRELC